jgi:hypothetical protein
MFCEMSVFESLRKWREDKLNCSGIRLERFLLVRSLKSVARCSARPPGSGDFLSMIDEGMSLTPLIFVLLILMFGFDLTGQVKTQLALKDRPRNLKFSSRQKPFASTRDLQRNRDTEVTRWRFRRVL